jgi:hypothetical protein
MACVLALPCRGVKAALQAGVASRAGAVRVDPRTRRAAAVASSGSPGRGSERPWAAPSRRFPGAVTPCVGLRPCAGARGGGFICHAATESGAGGDEPSASVWEAVATQVARFWKFGTRYLIHLVALLAVATFIRHVCFVYVPALLGFGRVDTEAVRVEGRPWSRVHESTWSQRQRMTPSVALPHDPTTCYR